MSPAQERELNAWAAFDAEMLKLNAMYVRGVPADIGVPGCPSDRRHQAIIVNRLWQAWMAARSVVTSE